MKASEIRKEARENLKSRWSKAVYITLAYMAISFVIGFIQEIFGEETIISKILDLVYIIINIPLSFGLLISFIKLKRGEDVKAFDYLNDGFNRFGKSYGIWFRTLLKLFLPIILLILTALPLYIILILLLLGLLSTAGISANYISIDTSILEIFDNIIPQFLNILPVLIILFILATIYMIRKSLLYVFAYNISYDNSELTSRECVLKSAELMKRNRIKYLLLELSFIGWAILSLFTFGIGIIWLTPYIQIATICFYEKLIKTETEKDDDVIKTK